MNFKSPLSLYIVWHPGFADGKKIADDLYSTFCRDFRDAPLVRKLGMPVYFRYSNTGGKPYPADINFEESEYTAIIVLLSEEFLLDDNYIKYLSSIVKKQKNILKARLFPVVFHNTVRNIHDKIGNNFKLLQSIDATLVKANRKPNLLKNQIVVIKSKLMHELCRMLLHANHISNSISLPPVKVFISYSNHDHSATDAEQFKEFIDKHSQLKSFFAPVDIALGNNFADEIKREAENSALVAFQSDTYSDREWCRAEIITAKAAECPVVVINNIKKREGRTFPYLGNCPSLRLTRKYGRVTNFQEVVDVILEQVLFRLFTKVYLFKLAEIYKLDKYFLLFNYPELFDFISLKKRSVGKQKKSKRIVLYPDPPLGSEEIRVLSDMDENYYFITPLTLHTNAL